MKKLYEIPGTDTAYTVEELIGMVMAGAVENKRLQDMNNKLLNHCPDAECFECSKIVCPHGCEMHFHHDGCPACAMAESEQVETTEQQLDLLGGEG